MDKILVETNRKKSKGINVMNILLKLNSSKNNARFKLLQEKKGRHDFNFKLAKKLIQNKERIKTIERKK